MNSIIDRVCAEFRISPGDLTGPCRNRKLVDARQLAAWLMMREGAYEEEIAKTLNRTLSSVYYYLAKAKSRTESDKRFRELAGRFQ